MCDDGSTDETMNILEDWTRTVPFEVRIVKNETNLGFARNFEKAAGFCTKDVVFLSDQDDIWLPEKLERMISFYEKDSEVLGVISDAFLVNSQNQLLPWKRSEMLRSNQLLSFFIWLPENRFPVCSGCCASYRKSFLKQLPSIPEGESHDGWFFLLAQTEGRVQFLSEPLLRCRIHETNTSGVQATEESIRKSNKRADYFYERAPGSFLYLDSKFQKFENLLETLPVIPGKKRLLKQIRRERKHFTNRERIQRNAFKFFPLAVWEFLTGRYFDWPKPFASAFFDLKKGLRIQDFSVKEGE